MLRMPTKWVLLMLVAAAGLPGKPCWAAAPAASLPGAVDPAFAGLVNLELIGQAVDTADSGLLTDEALLLANAESVLGRGHRSGVTAECLARKAFQLSSLRNDDGSLGRLESLAVRLGQTDLAGRIRLTRRTSHASRALQSGLVVDLDRVSTQQFLELRATLEAIRRAEAAGDGPQLSRLAAQVSQFSGLGQGVVQQLDGEIAKAQRKTPATPSTADDLLRRLAFHSRAVRAGTRASNSGAQAAAAGGGGSGGGSGGGGGKSSGSDPDSSRVAAEAQLRIANAQLITAVGDYTVKESQAGMNWTEVRAKNIQNNYQYAESFWKKRALHAQFSRAGASAGPAAGPVAAGPGPASGGPSAAGRDVSIQDVSAVTPMATVRPVLLKSHKPTPRLHQPVDWPHVFQADPFLDGQKRLSALLKARLPENSGLGSQNYLEIQATVAEMKGLLEERIHDYPPAIYVHAKKCLAAVEYEATLRVEPAGTAAAPAEVAVRLERLGGPSRGLSLEIVDPLLSESFVYEFLDGGPAGDELSRAWPDLQPADVAAAALALLARAEPAADDACRFAVELAAASGDASVLERIAATARQRGRTELAGQAQAARDKLAAVAAAPPARQIAVDATPLAAIMLYRAYLADIRQAAVTGKAPLLKTLLASLDAAPLLTTEQKGYLRQVAAWQGTDPALTAASARFGSTLDTEPAGRSIAALEQMIGLRQSLFNRLDQELTQATPLPLDSDAVQRTLMILYEAQGNGL